MYKHETNLIRIIEDKAHIIQLGLRSNYVVEAV